MSTAPSPQHPEHPERPEHEVTLVEVPARPTAVVRGRVRTSDLPEWFSSVYAEVARECAEQGAQLTGPPFARFHHLGAEMDLEAGFPVSHPVAAAGRMRPASLHACTAATTVHVGPYDDVGTAYDTLLCQVEARGRRAAGAFWEEYLTDPERVPDPSRWRTRIVQPLEPVSR
jgi:effector-binding domain-containing protein